jgi:hypothetical protein
MIVDAMFAGPSLEKRALQLLSGNDCRPVTFVSRPHGRPLERRPKKANAPAGIVPAGAFEIAV